MLKKILMLLGRIVPIWLPFGTAIGNRLLKPVYKIFFGAGSESIVIWGSVKMEVNPADCIGGNLYFSPQLYDIAERELIRACLVSSAVFVDVGANIGAYSLWVNSIMRGGGTIIAIEADPDTFFVLCGNLDRNKRCSSFRARNIGVADRCGQLEFYRNVKNNSGGNSFLKAANPDSSNIIIVPTKPLYEVIDEENVVRVDFMKVDIEGFELVVLRSFFEACKRKNRDLRPYHILVEVGEGPMRGGLDYTNDLQRLFEKNGYSLVYNGRNYLYKRIG